MRLEVGSSDCPHVPGARAEIPNRSALQTCSAGAGGPQRPLRVPARGPAVDGGMFGASGVMGSGGARREPRHARRGTLEFARPRDGRSHDGLPWLWFRFANRSKDMTFASRDHQTRMWLEAGSTGCPHVPRAGGVARSFGAPSIFRGGRRGRRGFPLPDRSPAWNARRCKIVWFPRMSHTVSEGHRGHLEAVSPGRGPTVDRGICGAPGVTGSGDGGFEPRSSECRTPKTVRRRYRLAHNRLPWLLFRFANHSKGIAFAIRVRRACRSVEVESPVYPHVPRGRRGNPNRQLAASRMFGAVSAGRGLFPGSWRPPAEGVRGFRRRGAPAPAWTTTTISRTPEFVGPRNRRAHGCPTRWSVRFANHLQGEAFAVVFAGPAEGWMRGVRDVHVIPGGPARHGAACRSTPPPNARFERGRIVDRRPFVRRPLRGQDAPGRPPEKIGGWIPVRAGFRLGAIERNRCPRCRDVRMRCPKRMGAPLCRGFQANPALRLDPGRTACSPGRPSKRAHPFGTEHEMRRWIGNFSANAGKTGGPRRGSATPMSAGRNAGDPGKRRTPWDVRQHDQPTPDPP